MKILNTGYEIRISHLGEIKHNFENINEFKIETNPIKQKACIDIKKLFNTNRKVDPESKRAEFLKIFNENFNIETNKKLDNVLEDLISNVKDIDENEFNENIKLAHEKYKNNKNTIKNIIVQIINFFKEFNYTPSFRFINTLFQNPANQRKTFVNNYFEIQNNSANEQIKVKLNSPEFSKILEDIKKINITDIPKINTRLKVYYGDPGTGKTTKALEETNKCIVCHQNITPADIMEDFTFIDGKATFTPSSLYNAIINGEKIVFDEINLLPYETLRFLQTITDSKKQFEYKGKTLNIHPDFQIIGTMNLNVDDMIQFLPAALTDRCEQIIYFKPSIDNFINSILGNNFDTGLIESSI